MGDFDAKLATISRVDIGREILGHIFGMIPRHREFPWGRGMLAEAVRFELTNGCPLPVFKTGAIDHSATLPVAPRVVRRAAL
jgi:hypothetical protein